ncbi:MAG: nicotinamide riboside transporter PnuC [Saprospiraceae bacterium]
MNFFNINHVFFSILHYPVSYIEFIGSIAGIIAVWLAAKSKLLTWPIGIINIVLFFFIFWQVQLYSDMFLQIYFFGISLYGWHNWKREKQDTIPIKILSNRSRINNLILILIASIFFGYIVSNLPQYFPAIFNKPAAFPYLDTFVGVSSIVANTLMAKRIMENWLLWIAINIVCVGLYLAKDIAFVALEYFVFLILAVVGHVSWQAERNKLISLQIHKK